MVKRIPSKEQGYSRSPSGCRCPFLLNRMPCCRNRSKKKEKPAAEPQVRMPGELHTKMYQTFLGVMKTALAQPNRTMSAEELLDKICPAGLFSDEERAKLLQEAREQ